MISVNNIGYLCNDTNVTVVDPNKGLHFEYSLHTLLQKCWVIRGVSTETQYSTGSSWRACSLLVIKKKKTFTLYYYACGSWLWWQVHLGNLRRNNGSRVYFLLIVFWVILLLDINVVLMLPWWHDVTMVQSDITIVVPWQLSTASKHDYLFCYCHPSGYSIWGLLRIGRGSGT